MKYLGSAYFIVQSLYCIGMAVAIGAYDSFNLTFIRGVGMLSLLGFATFLLSCAIDFLAKDFAEKNGKVLDKSDKID